MSLETLAWLFTLGVLLHNAEEALLLPRRPLRLGPWRVRAAPREFALAALIFSLLLLGLTWQALRAGAGSAWAYAYAGCVFAMLVNVFLPHGLGTLLLRRYLPGTATALLLNLPLGLLFLRQALAQGFVQAATLRWAAPLMALLVLASLPVMFAAGRLILKHAGRKRLSP